MRLIGLTLCFLVSSFSARAESVEERVAALEARVKTLENALRTQTEKTAAAKSIEGTYKAVLQNGDSGTVELTEGRVLFSSGSESKTGTYEVVGQRVIATVEGKTEVLRIEGDHLKSDKIELIRTK